MRPRLSPLGDQSLLPAIFQYETVKLIPAFCDLAIEGWKLHHLLFIIQFELWNGRVALLFLFVKILEKVVLLLGLAEGFISHVVLAEIAATQLHLLLTDRLRPYRLLPHHLLVAALDLLAAITDADTLAEIANPSILAVHLHIELLDSDQITGLK